MTNRGLVAFALLPGALLAEIVSIDFAVSDYEGNPLSDVKIDYYTDGKLIAPYIKTPKRHLSCTTDQNGKVSNRFHWMDSSIVILQRMGFIR